MKSSLTLPASLLLSWVKFKETFTGDFQLWSHRKSRYVLWARRPGAASNFSFYLAVTSPTVPVLVMALSCHWTFCKAFEKRTRIQVSALDPQAHVEGSFVSHTGDLTCNGIECRSLSQRPTQVTHSDALHSVSSGLTLSDKIQNVFQVQRWESFESSRHPNMNISQKPLYKEWSSQYGGKTQAWIQSFFVSRHLNQDVYFHDLNDWMHLTCVFSSLTIYPCLIMHFYDVQSVSLNG